MSARGPLWFCHECHAEMRPLMVPDPVCAECRGSFVEKLENTADDPRQFATNTGDFEGGEGDAGLGTAALLMSLQALMDRGMGTRNDINQRTNTGPAITFEVRGPSGSRTMHFGGGGNTTGGGNNNGSPRPNEVPNMSAFLRASPFGIPLPATDGPDRPNISGPLMAQYLMALLGHNEPGMFGMPENGRMGDYVYNQEALDQIISQIMENSNAHRPVPATEEIIAKLPREVLLQGSPTLEHDCAVCKEQFKLETEDPDEQIVVTLPCKHPFHQPCILPWLTSSGTCPVCRHALVPQPEHHSTPNRTPGPDPGEDQSRPPPPGPGSNNNSGHGSEGGSGAGGGAGGLFQSIFHGLAGLAHPTQNNNNNHNNRNITTNSSSPRQSGSRSPRPTSAPRSPQQQYQSQSHSHSPPFRSQSHSPPQLHSRRSNSNPSSQPSHPSPRSSNGRRDQNNGSNNLPGSWSDELD